MEMETKKLQSTETNNELPKHIKRWIYVSTDDKEPKIKQTLLRIEVPDNLDDEEWKSLERSIDIARELAIESWHQRKEEEKKKTVHGIMYRTIYTYDAEHVEAGEIIEKLAVERRKHGIPNPIMSTAKNVETFLFINQSENSSRMWINDDILDDLMERGIEEIRIMVEDKMFFLRTELFLTYGKMEGGKVYLEITKPPFEVREFMYAPNNFDVYAPVV